VSLGLCKSVYFQIENLRLILSLCSVNHVENCKLCFWLVRKKLVFCMQLFFLYGVHYALPSDNNNDQLLLLLWFVWNERSNVTCGCTFWKLFCRTCHCVCCLSLVTYVLLLIFQTVVSDWWLYYFMLGMQCVSIVLVSYIYRRAAYDKTGWWLMLGLFFGWCSPENAKSEVQTFSL